jgi:hypothetical protein
MAFVAGAAIWLAAWFYFQPDFAAARGPSSTVFAAIFGSAANSGDLELANDVLPKPLSLLSHRKAKKPHVSNSSNTILSAGLMPRRSVCVRLCDGFFFPVGPINSAGDVANHQADCAGLCPAAPTALYFQPAGSDKIEDAVSATGAPYSTLPVAFRNRTTEDNTCTCHRTLAQNYSVLRDFTLRRGDSVMTPRGFVVFQGARRLPYVRKDFTALAADASMPRDKHAALREMEHAEAQPSRSAAGLWFPAPPKLAGNVVRLSADRVSRNRDPDNSANN